MSADEEWLRTIIASERNASKHPTAKRLIDGEIIRSFRRRPQFARRLVENARFVNATTESGIIVPNQPAFVLEDDRLNRVIRKMVRGLFYTYSFRRQDRGTPLPKGWPITVSRVRTNEEFQKCDQMMDAWPLSLQWWSIGVWPKPVWPTKYQEKANAADPERLAAEGVIMRFPSRSEVV